MTVRRLEENKELCTFEKLLLSNYNLSVPGSTAEGMMQSEISCQLIDQRSVPPERIYRNACFNQRRILLGRIRILVVIMSRRDI
jgi:hypothetical protein